MVTFNTPTSRDKNFTRRNPMVCVSMLIFLLVSCSPNPPHTPSNNPIRIGAIFMLTGIGAEWGTNAQRGADLAVDEINRKGGVLGRPLELIYEDNKSDDPALAVTILMKLIRDGITIVLGPNWSGSGLALAPIACENGVLMMSPSLGVAEFNERCDSLFNVWPHDADLSRSLGRDLFDSGKSRIAILGSTDVWESAQANAVKEGYESAGGKVLSFQLVEKDTRDLGTEAVKILSINPDAVVLTNYISEDVASQRLREVGVTAPFFTVLIDDSRVKASKGAMEGAFVITSFSPSQEFTEKFEHVYREEPGIPADSSYDSVYLIAQAIEHTNSTDPSALKVYLHSVKVFDGASGTLFFDQKGGVRKNHLFMQVKNGTVVPAPGSF